LEIKFVRIYCGFGEAKVTCTAVEFKIDMFVMVLEKIEDWLYSFIVYHKSVELRGVPLSHFKLGLTLMTHWVPFAVELYPPAMTGVMYGRGGQFSENM